ncbi:MAG: 23S rRNA (pseudouridine(1915)-N(3))-methyltransferase RlmH [Alistipes sp.]|jgi:23S rRNA (pseudouridine1915-N3)-methyltransferase|nr:23S rRNA (pseudouridine(1915)-N(3))-methyltransferase RlmH [Alistipes sp.]MBQ1957989.1 23S rRNA (pseudouridine(1915)-N(3))-methyltransferase RlmH [Alistipes sp.]MBQ1980754.1 23S rRNA (pseudouridine(1915)-N(3))-methyltransferase RlmH [Alistipes sp.]MBQ2415103.1 23S rRNA (pseudouridine(1915)-N(3))-methyltransferase RlmH [Alistipes sp.]MBQ5622855.1 23S rRNA (pseudouridine(1915)-N(3))-methyltransferase RlmH [Alistipes sp.]
MNIELIVIGKTDQQEVASLVEQYAKRVNHYCKFTVTTIADVKNTRNMAPSRQKQLEGEMILRLISDGDWLVLMDERGRQFTSMEYADWLQKRMLSGVKRLAIVIGGPYGFSDEVYKRANEKISLSKMTFSHQIVRAIFAEQLYRAFTILNNEPYHHE